METTVYSNKNNMKKNNIKIIKTKKIIKNKKDIIELISTRDRIITTIILNLINKRKC